MIATRQTAVRDGDGGDACLVTASANIFEDLLFPAPIVAFSDEWNLVPHTVLPSCQTLYRASSVGYVTGPRRGNGIVFERQSQDFRTGGSENIRSGRRAGSEEWDMLGEGGTAKVR
jgi:hypothetical protein